MPSLVNHQSGEYTKLLLLGDSGTGKSGALASLAKDYKLRILDMDNGLDPLVQNIKRTHGNLANVEYRTLRDNKVATPLGMVIQGMPKAFVDAIKMLDNWEYTIEGNDRTALGKPSTWGKDTILVIDSFSFLSDAAFDWAEPLVPSGKAGKDPRQIYGNAQKALENVLAGLTSESFRTNVIVTAHVRFIDMPDGTMKGYPLSIGKALSPAIPRYFNSAALMQNVGGTRTLQVGSNPFVDLKNPAAFKMTSTSLPIDTGLADFFRAVRS